MWLALIKLEVLADIFWSLAMLCSSSKIRVIQILFSVHNWCIFWIVQFFRCSFLLTSQAPHPPVLQECASHVQVLPVLWVLQHKGQMLNRLYCVTHFHSPWSCYWTSALLRLWTSVPPWRHRLSPSTLTSQAPRPPWRHRLPIHVDITGSPSTLTSQAPHPPWRHRLPTLPASAPSDFGLRLLNVLARKVLTK